MAFEIPKITYTGKIKEVSLGKGPKTVTVGGSTSYPFHLFEGDMARSSPDCDGGLRFAS